VTDTRFFQPYGIYIDRAVGTHKWDVDGNQYLDFFGGHGANLLGHSHPVLVDTVREAIGCGVQFAANQRFEIALAREVLRMMPAAQRVRFTGSGTEATMLALRLARAYTGRKKIVRFASHYHGWHDHAVSGYVAQFDGSPAPGILPEVAAQTLLICPNDVEGLARTVEDFGSEIAAFIIEPVGTHFGLIPVSPSFLHTVQRAARTVGALFILDEVLSGFRVALGGAQSVYGLEPDLTTLAKILCGGMPGGAVAGRAGVMDLLDFDEARRPGRPKVLHQGTFTANPVSTAAGLAVLREIERTDACSRANHLGALMRRRLNEMSVAERLPLRWYGEFSAFHMRLGDVGGGEFPQGSPETRLRQPQPFSNRFRMAINVLGADINTRCGGLLSSIHTEDEIAQYVSAVAAAATMLKRENLLAQ
jgi:glutamate-1-semialdehyde 2,1-aminomutase